MSNNYEYHRIPSVEMEEQINNYDNDNIEEQLLLSSTVKENDLFPVPLDTIDTIQQSKNSVSFDLTFCNRFLRICRILFSPLNPYGNLISILCSFIIISLTFEVVVYFVGTIPSRFYTVLIGQDFEGFKYELIWGMGFVFCAGLGKSLVKFVGGIFYLLTRKILTKYLQNQYVDQNTFYRFLSKRMDIDNPDQRIAQDIDKFAAKLREIMEEVLVSPVLIAYYTYQTWKLCGYLGPLMIYSYFFISFISSRFLISPIVNLVFMKEFHEGNFRFLHIRIRQFSESIAFGFGERAEKVRLDKYFNKILIYMRQIIEKELILETFTDTIAYLGAILSYIMIAIPIFIGVYDNVEKEKLGGIISLNAFLSMYLINQFSKIVEQSTRISDLAGYTSRIGQLLEALEEINMELENVDIDNPFNEPPRPPNSELSINFDQVTIMTPSGNRLLSEFKFTIEQENNVMIIGPNGSGKSSILRVMCGLWSTPEGLVTKPFSISNQQRILLYLPQTPYLVFGSLRDQLSYPMINDEKNCHVTDEEVDNLLSLVNLTHVKSLVRNYDEQYGMDWDKMLSPGEIQRLSIARLFYWKPAFAALDESTSSLDAVTESNFFEKCKEFNITCITVSHNMNLLKYHDKVLLLDGKGHYATSDIDINGTENIERWIDGILVRNNGIIVDE
ncbi:hypothetical protein Glove_203g47 [Diversispora epigaea]|uniref:ABC transporter domain-containing protein n=1 Tax=Diversispora epigaea TaxID=1348612 RepID=A0A397IQU9_9GLOM|nr:hypothetical protein Glove_203g47 [Diversispora epigaea]